MINSVWLDIAIGMVMVWFLFALAVSAINEGVAKVLSLRSKQLWSALRQMLDGTEHPKGVLRSLIGLPTKSRPSSPYPAANAPVSARLYATQTLQALEIRTKDTQKTKIEFIPASVFSHSILEMAASAQATVAGAVAGAGGIDPAIGQVQAYIDQLPAGPLRAQLGAVLAGAGNDITQFRVGVESWFNGQMTRLSRLYRAQVHVILVLIGLVVAIGSFAMGMQSNSLKLASDLQHDQNLRTILVGAATSAVRDDLASRGCPPPNSGAAATPTSNSSVLTPASDTTSCQLHGVSKLDHLDLVLYGDSPRTHASISERLGFLFSGHHLTALLGVLITGIAISFGSSFWFAVLKKLVGLKGSSGGSSS